MQQLAIPDGLRLAGLLAACALVSCLELFAPLFPYKSGRIRRAVPNLILSAGVVTTNLALAWITAALSSLVARWHAGLFPAMHLRGWLLLLFGVAGLDLSAYVAHVLLHKLRLGWRFHRVHHSEQEVDVTTAFRQHPGETLWRFMWQCAGTVALGVPFWLLPLYVSLSSLNALLEHANVKVSEPFDRWLRWVFVTPNMHKTHHSRKQSETDSNYSNIFSFWDRLFHTYRAHVDFSLLRYGLDHFDEDQGTRDLLMAPFR